MLGLDIYDNDKMNLLWIEDFPLFLPKEDGSEGEVDLHYVLELGLLRAVLCRWMVVSASHTVATTFLLCGKQMSARCLEQCVCCQVFKEGQSHGGRG